MLTVKRTSLACLVVATGTLISAQTPLGPEATALRSHFALQALDRYLETWNSREPLRWAGSLHFPHVRPSPGEFAISKTPEEYAAGVDFGQTLKTGWHHSEWDSRRVLQVGVDKVHVSGQWTRYTAEGKTLTGSAITYIVTEHQGRWGVLSRFAAGPTGIDATTTTANGAAALAALKAHFAAWNGHNGEALAATFNYPYVRIADGAVDVSASPAEFLRGAEPGRQRTWFETRLEQADAVQVSTAGVNITFRYSRRGRDGSAMSSYEALALVTNRGGAWKVQAISSFGP
jgi:hypothetical protein